MKLYNKKTTRRFEDKMRRGVVETRDAIIWSVDTSNYYCLCKIQNSNTLIKAHYPRNWDRLPNWVKAGNAVMIRHRQGMQGYIEVIGSGRAIPSPLAGGDAVPEEATLTNRIVSGMTIMAHPGGGMNVYAESGVIMINGVNATYTAPATAYTEMDDPAAVVMGGTELMGYGSNFTATAIDAAPPSGYSRYDGLFMGADGVLDYIAGTYVALSQEPTMPATPEDHIMLGHIWVYGGMTEITQSDIGALWYDRAISTIDYGGSLWGGDYFGVSPPVAPSYTPVSGSMTFSVVDQYGAAISVSTTARFNIVYGHGMIGSSPSSFGTGEVTRLVGSQTTFYYQRSSGDTIAPLLSLTFDGRAPLSRYFPVEYLLV